MDAAGHQELRDQWPSGAQRLQRTGPFPAVVAPVRAATAQQGHPRAPTVALLESDNVLDGAASSSARQQVATRLGLPQDAGPPVHLPWCHVRRGPQGARRGSGPPVPSDLDAKGGSPVATQHPAKKEAVLGSVHRTTTARNRALAWAWPLGHSPSPAAPHAGTTCIEPRTALAVPVLPGQGHLRDAAHAVTANAHWLPDQGGLAVFAATPRHAPRAPASLVNRGSAASSTP